MHLIGLVAGPAGLAAHRHYRIEHRPEVDSVIVVGGAKRKAERRARSIDQEVPLRPCLAPLH
ncbi:hypothetical protein GCM10011504_33980 [Siccirubricoccus deserti]|nr:hypothetical protein GCM10011504_33980 [Siccirubricoccus deserti]